MKNTERIGWLLIGAAAGAGIALLYAPVSGKEARKLIRKTAEDAKDSVVEMGEQVRDKVVEASESVADAARGVYRKGATMAAGAAGVFEAGRRVAKG
jgi:gas vesicle protein